MTSHRQMRQKGVSKQKPTRLHVLNEQHGKQLKMKAIKYNLSVSNEEKLLVSILELSSFRSKQDQHKNDRGSTNGHLTNRIQKTIKNCTHDSRNYGRHIFINYYNLCGIHMIHFHYLVNFSCYQNKYLNFIQFFFFKLFMLVD